MAYSSTGCLKASEETFDYTCSVCRKKDRVSEAVKYCQECHKYLCTSCLDQHNDYMEDHTLVEPSAAGSGVVMPTEKCRQHGQKLIELWCKKHGEVICSICAFMDHRSCEEVKFIPGDIDNLLQDSELRETIDGLKMTQERLATLKGERSLAVGELLIEKKKYLDMIENQKRKIIQKVESLEEAAREEIKVWYIEREKKIQEDQDCCDQLERDIVPCLQQLETALVNKPQLFVSMKKGQKLLFSAKKVADGRGIQTNPDKRFEVNNDLEKQLADLQSLGSFKKWDRLYKATNTTKVNVKLSRDSDTCDIYGTCILSDGDILMTDVKNKRLKRLDGSTYTVTDHYDLSGSPWGLCCVGQKEVAVCLDYKIHLVSVNKTMTLAKIVKLETDCCGVGFSNGELFVSDAYKKVHVYNLSGTLLRTINQTPFDGAMFALTRHIAVNGDRLFVADREKGLICTDRNGTVLFRYKGPQVTGAFGVCTDGQGGVFLGGLDSHNVVQVGADGEDLGVILTQTDGLMNPKSVCFNPSSQKLIVTNGHSDEILMFDLV